MKDKIEINEEPLTELEARQQEYASRCFYGDDPMKPDEFVGLSSRYEKREPAWWGLRGRIFRTTMPVLPKKKNQRMSIVLIGLAIVIVLVLAVLFS